MKKIDCGCMDRVLKSVLVIGACLFAAGMMLKYLI